MNPVLILCLIPIVVSFVLIVVLARRFDKRNPPAPSDLFTCRQCQKEKTAGLMATVNSSARQGLCISCFMAERDRCR